MPKLEYSKVPTQHGVEIKTPTVEDCLQDPAKWNDTWEVVIDLGVFTPEILFVSDLGQYNSSKQAEYAELFRTTLGVRAMLVRMYANFDGDSAFEAKWLKADKETRRRHVLLALARACSTSPYMNHARTYHGKLLTLRRLTVTGLEVIDLMRCALPDDFSHPMNDVAHIPDTEWDNFRDSKLRAGIQDKERLVLDHLYMLKTRLMCERVSLRISH